jgi:hypothetical protein
MMDGEKIKEKFFTVFSDMTDFAVRELDFGKTKLYIAYFVGFSSREYMNKYMIEPISRAYAAREAVVPLSSLITNVKIEKLKDFTSAKDAVLAGNAVLFGDVREDIFGISVFTKNPSDTNDKILLQDFGNGKLATELAKRETGRTLYILDEPTTGLHFEDIRQLLDVINRLVDCGNTAVVIEHNLDVIKVADWIVDMGPEGGRDGGMVVAQGTPSDIAKCKESYTGHYLKDVCK